MRKNKKQRVRLKHEKMRNRRLIKKYPWLIPRNVWTDKIPDDYDYSYIEWYGWPHGWNVAFGNMYLEEFGDAVKEAGLEKKMRIEQQKEKFGYCCNYVYPVTDKISQIINKYEYISENICIICGKPDVPMINDGWLSPWCFDCWKKNYRRREKWYLEHSGGSEKISDEEVRQKYDKCICDVEHVITNSYTIRRFSVEGTIDTTYDISETVEAVRERWKKRGRNSRKCN